MPIQLQIALTHLTSRKRQTLVSLGGVILGVAFFLAVSSLMRGSEQDFIKRLIDNSPHITIYDEYRRPQTQPAQMQWPDAAISISHLTPKTENRGIRSYREKLAFIELIPGLQVAPVLIGPAVLSFAGREQSGSLSGIIPAKMKTVSTIQEKMLQGSLDALTANPNGIIIGKALADKFQLGLGRNLNLVTQDGGNRVMKVVGIYRTGNANYDETQTFSNLKPAQVMFNRPNRVNRLLIKLQDAYQANLIAKRIEANIGYKATSWIEASEDILSLLTVRNIIMFSVVSAILIVASFGIYNTLSTIVMEKTRDIAILKSMGFHATDIRLIFLFEGSIIGALGSVLGLLLGAGLMLILGQIQVKPPGVLEMTNLPVWWGVEQFELAAAFALTSCILAAYLPARRAGDVHPVDILRGQS